LTMQAIGEVSGKGITVRGNNIDTDRIIPARFMKCVTFDGLGAFAFNDERFDESGKKKNHPFDDSRWAGNPVLITNSNFGCGSSREHAPQALKDYGIRAIIGESFAEIFAGNCFSLGIPALKLEVAPIATLQALIESNPNTVVLINLRGKTVSAGGWNWVFSMPESHRRALLDGTWDSMAVLGSASDEIAMVASRLPYVRN